MDAARKSIFPSANDSWESIAARELATTDKEQALSQLQSWKFPCLQSIPAALFAGKSRCHQLSRGCRRDRRLKCGKSRR